MEDMISRQALCEYALNQKDKSITPNDIMRFPSAQQEQQNARIFQGIIVEYPSISTYPEYEGKPYFSIKYTENGQDFIGYGTYKPDVLSEYLKKYFMPFAQLANKSPKVDKESGELISRQAAIDAHYEYCNKHPDASFPVWSLKILEDLPPAQPEKRTDKCTETHACDLISRQEAVECNGFREVERDDERRSN